MTTTIERDATIPRDALTADISDRAFRLYVLLRAHNGPALKSQAAMSREFGMHPNYVSRAVRELIDAGLLTRFGLNG